MATKTAARETSKGICTFCKAEIDKARMTQHLKHCKQRQAAIAAEAESSPESQKTRLFHIMAEGRYNPQYWMHFEIPASDTMLDLDYFLRAIWVECCDHLSAFKVGTINYSSEPEDWYFFENEEEAGEEEIEAEEELDDTANEVEALLTSLPPDFAQALPPDLLSEMKKFQSLDDLLAFLYEETKKATVPVTSPYTEEHRTLFLRKSILRALIHELEDRDMEAPLEKALKVGQKFTYEYDFGSTTYLALKVMSEREGIVRGQDEDEDMDVDVDLVTDMEDEDVEDEDMEDAIVILAQNIPPVIPCIVCGKPAKGIAPGYYYAEDNAYCSSKCAKKKGESYEEMLPVVNSPRVGICGYTGDD